MSLYGQRNDKMWHIITNQSPLCTVCQSVSKLFPTSLRWAGNDLQFIKWQICHKWPHQATGDSVTWPVTTSHRDHHQVESISIRRYIAPVQWYCIMIHISTIPDHITSHGDHHTSTDLQCSALLQWQCSDHSTDEITQLASQPYRLTVDVTWRQLDM